MLQRRTLNSTPVAMPKKIFCLDFEDPVMNTNRIVTDTVAGIQFTKSVNGDVSFLENYNGFGRAIKCNTRSINNLYQIAWQSAKIKLPANFPHGTYSYVWFTNSLGNGFSNRSGLMDVSNEGRLIGWQEGDGYYNVYATIAKTMYSGYENVSDISMFAFCYDEATGKSRTQKAVDTVSMLNVAGAFSMDSFNTGQWRFLGSQESSYFFCAGSICAGICFYEGVLTTEQLQAIFDAKRFL